MQPGLQALWAEPGLEEGACSLGLGLLVGPRQMALNLQAETHHQRRM